MGAQRGDSRGQWLRAPPPKSHLPRLDSDSAVSEPGSLQKQLAFFALQVLSLLTGMIIVISGFEDCYQD